MKALETGVVPEAGACVLRSGRAMPVSTLTGIVRRENLRRLYSFQVIKHQSFNPRVPGHHRQPSSIGGLLSVSPTAKRGNNFTTKRAMKGHESTGPKQGGFIAPKGLGWTPHKPLMRKVNANESESREGMARLNLN